MEIVQTVINAVVVAAVGLILGWMVHGLRSEMNALRSEVNALRSEVKSDIAQLRTEMREDIQALRSDLTQVALAVGARPRAENE